MTMRSPAAKNPRVPDLPNGSGAAAALSAGIGCFLIALLALAAERLVAVRTFFNFYRPTGPLSGVTTAAIVGWLVCWLGLDARWRHRNVALARVCAVALTLLGLSVVLTFPPIAELF